MVSLSMQNMFESKGVNCQNYIDRLNQFLVIDLISRASHTNINKNEILSNLKRIQNSQLMLKTPKKLLQADLKFTKKIYFKLFVKKRYSSLINFTKLVIFIKKLLHKS